MSELPNREDSSTLRKSGIDVVGEVPWGTHLCQFYKTKQDLVDILVPYFKAGLQDNEFCMWITSEPLNAGEAKRALKKSVPDFADYLNRGQIEVLPYQDWYTRGGGFNSDRVLNDWVSKLETALARGFSGLRLTGNTFWLESRDWPAFTDYEEAINNVIGKYKMIAVCTYSLDKCNANEIIDVVRNHQFAIIKRSGKWELIESSETKRVAKALIGSERKFTALYNSMIEGVAFHEVVYDNSGKAVDYVITDVNPSYESITGLSKDETTGRLASELYRAEAPPYLEIYAKVASTGESTSFETYFPPMQKHFSISVFSASKGKFTTVFHDITKRTKTEQALRESQEDLNRAQAVAQTGSWRLDVPSNRLLWSDETYRMFGIPKGSPLTYEIFLNAVHPDDRAYVDQKWNSGLRGEPYDIEHRILANNKVKWVHERAELEFNEEGTLKGGFGTVQDITERKELEAKLEEYAKHLEELVEEKTRQLRDAERLSAIGQTAGMVGHDIRNPLQSIIGEIYLAKDELRALPKSVEKQNLIESMATIEDQVGYINKIVTDLQDFAKPLQPCAEQIDLGQIVRSVATTVSIPQNIEVTYCLADNFPNFVADAAFMKRILTNLFSNAVQAMPDGGELSFHAYHRDNRVIMTVEDTGIGIPDEAKPKMFQPLFTTKSRGQGFGLAVCKRLVGAMNGSISFESQVGKGTKFIVDFPYNSRV